MSVSFKKFMQEKTEQINEGLDKSDMASIRTELQHAFPKYKFNVYANNKSVVYIQIMRGDLDFATHGIFKNKSDANKKFKSGGISWVSSGNTTMNKENHWKSSDTVFYKEFNKMEKIISNAPFDHDPNKTHENHHYNWRLEIGNYKNGKGYEYSLDGKPVKKKPNPLLAELLKIQKETKNETREFIIQRISSEDTREWWISDITKKGIALTLYRDKSLLVTKKLALKIHHDLGNNVDAFNVLIAKPKTSDIDFKTVFKERPDLKTVNDLDMMLRHRSLKRKLETTTQKTNPNTVH